MAVQYSDLSVLVVDDDPFIYDLLDVYLRRTGVTKIYFSTNSDETLRTLSKNKIDIIFLDISLNGENCIKIIKKLDGMHYQGGISILSQSQPSLLRAIRKIAQDRNLNLLNINLKSDFNQTNLKNTLDKYISRPTLNYFKLASQTQYTELDILTAINNDEFYNLVMPIVDIRTGELNFLELLIRWKHPEHGTVEPPQFINIINENEILAIKFNQYVLQKALIDLHNIHKNFKQIRIAINISPVCFTNPQFCQDLIRTFEKAQIVPALVVFEITEVQTIFHSGVLESLAELHLAGFTISLDDYGVGYSNLSQLFHGPFDEVKLDMQFVQLINTDENAHKLISVISMIGAEFGMKVVAEGIESESIWNIIKNSGYNFAQGYFISPPIAPEQLTLWYDDWGERYIDMITIHPNLQTLCN